MPNSTTEYSNLVELLRHRATEKPDQILYTALKDGENSDGSLTYQQLDLQARAIAGKLQPLISPGDRVLLIYPYSSPLEFAAAFFGCLYAGAIAVTASPPRSQKSLLNIQNRVISSEAKIALTTSQFLDKIQVPLSQYSSFLPKLAALQWITTNDLSTDSASTWQQPQLDWDTLAFFQYTSGSTGLPKGVMVTHGNMLHNGEVIRTAFEHTQESRALIWLPLFHDMGLIGGIIQPLYADFHMFLTSPIALIQQPVRWLRAISTHKITTSGGPNFAYDLLCNKVKPEQREGLDLSSWDLAFSGAETIRAQTLEKFSQLYSPYGFRKEAFYPCYGMAETTLLISGAVKKEVPGVKYLDSAALAENRVVEVDATKEGAKAIVSCGKAWLGDKILIVDPDTCKQCPEDRIGEIWVAGAGVGKGYWHEPEKTTSTFGANLDTGEGNFLRTGDLGFYQDGELYITGRIKEIMILWGNNYYPQHIEETAEKAHSALRPNSGAAFAIEAEGEERLVIAHEVERTALRNLNVEEIITNLCQAIGQEHVVDVYGVALLKPGSIPKTSSGKIQRGVCKNQFLSGDLATVAQWQQSQAQERGMTDLLGNVDAGSS